MKKIIRNSYIIAGLFGVLVLSSAFIRLGSSEKLSMPYKKAGLNPEQAAAHLLSRFTFGATPKQVNEVVKIGLDKWMKQQLEGKQDDDELNKMLANYDAINLSNTAANSIFPRAPYIKRMAIKEGFISKDSINGTNKKYERQKLEEYMTSKGYRPSQEFFRQFFNQKILRAAYSNNQLREVLTDFWFNHFNVAIIKPICANFIPAYERDIIRPNVLGDFETLLIKTAKSPAMLYYLDNFSSVGYNNPMFDKANDMKLNPKMNVKQRTQAIEKAQKAALSKMAQQKGKKGKSGLNENYAREVMELHTLGVDGGYTQSDVTQAARVLTGWTVAPLGEGSPGYGLKNTIDRLGKEKLEEKGYVLDGDFLFAINKHDNDEKVVLGHRFPEGGGYEEGVQLLTMLAHHPSTAKFISKKLAVRFVSDNPPQSLVDRMAKTFTTSKGNIKSVIITMVNSPEFWQTHSLREKIKSPFELAISAVRSVDAKISQPFQLYSWINKMGQQIYYYQAPTGFPDNGQYWINTGSLLNRMNFGLAFASQRIPGVSIDLAALNNNHEPESVAAALSAYGEIILPGRDLSQTVSRLQPMLNDPNIQNKVSKAANKNDLSKPLTIDSDTIKMKKMKKENINPDIKMQPGNNSMLAQVVGVIIGSPEFQRK